MEEKIKLEIFTSIFDPHSRGKQCLRTIKKIQENEEYSLDERNGAKPYSSVITSVLGKKLSSENREHLLKYAAAMAKRISGRTLSVSSFERNISDGWRFCLFFGKTDISKLTQEQIKDWWKFLLLAYEKKEFKLATLERQYSSALVLEKFVFGLNKKQSHPLFACLEMPEAPAQELEPIQPTQKDVKALLEAAYIEGKRFSIRDRAIFALANDTGARISEILSMRNEHVKSEKNYLVVSFPESKTAPRTVISFLAKPYLEEWAKVSPNRNKGDNAFFFCLANGKSVGYGAIAKALGIALRKSKVRWAKNKKLHYFRAMFASRAYSWAYAIKNYWMGWSFRNEEGAYTRLNYTQCVESYFEMIKKENNPLAREETVFWDEKSIESKIIERLFSEKPEFRQMIREMVREVAGK